MLMREGESVYVGDTGFMPGFLAAVVCHPATSLGVMVLANTTSNLKVGQLALQVLSLARGGAPSLPEWLPGERPPERLVPFRRP